MNISHVKLFFRYHKKCYIDFVNEKSIKAVKNSFDHTSDDKEPFISILNSIRNEDKNWTLVE